MKEFIQKPAFPLSIFARIGHLTYRYRALIIAIWGLLLLLSLAIAPRLENVLQGVVTTYDAGEALQTEQVLRQELAIESDALTLVFESLDNRPLLEHQTEVEQQLTQILNLSAVKEVVSASERREYLSTDGRTAYSRIYLKVNGIDVYPVISDIQQILAEQERDTLGSYLTGKEVFNYEDQRISETDLVRAEALALPLTLIALLFVFGSVVAAVMPVAMAVMTVSVSSGLLYLVALEMDISVFALNLTTMLGLGIGIDFTLVMVSRFREELGSSSTEQAVARTVDTAGRAVFFSGLTTCIGLVSLLLFPINLLRSLGVAGSLVVFLSIAAALTLVPALFGVLGNFINRWRIIRPTRGNQGFWSFLARLVIRHSVPAVALVLVIVTILISPFFEAQWGLGGIKTLPAGVEARQGVEVIEKSFGVGTTSPILLSVRSTDNEISILSEDNIATLYDLVDQWQSDSRVAKVNSLFNLDSRLSKEKYQQLYTNLEFLPSDLADAVERYSSDSTTLIAINSNTDGNDEASFELVKELRNLNREGLEFFVGGQTSSSLDIIEVVTQRFPWVLAAMMGVTFIALTILFQSVVIPLKAIFLNLMSISASFGALVFVFQQGNLQNLLDFTPVGYSHSK